MTELPRRITLVAQVADILRVGLHRGDWDEFLPGENALCGQLQVSRPTIRSALDLLRREGLIEISKGRRPRITQKAPRRALRSESNVVAFLSGIGWEEMESYTLFRISELRAHLQDAGYKLEVHADPRLDRRRPFRMLERLIQERRACCWLLHLTNHAVQQWFDDRGMRAIVLGSPPGSIHFPSIDRDYRSIARHAVGVLLGIGHRRITLLVRNSNEGGDLATEQGFLDGFEKADPADNRILRHDGTIKNIRLLLGSAFRARARPTALVVRNPGAVLTVASHLMNSGIRMPQDVSLIALDDERYLHHLTPAIVRYRIDWNAYATRLSRMVIQLAATGTLAARRILVMPQFEKGETIAPV